MATTRSPLRAGIVSAAALFVAALAFPSTIFCQRAIVIITIAGQVRTADGSPVPNGATVSLETGRGERVAAQPVGADGSFEFDQVAPRNYYVTVTAENFQTFRQFVNSGIGVSANYTVDVTLKPLANRKVPASALPALTDEAAPKGARKEYEAGAKALKKKDLEKARQHLEKAVAEYPCYARAQAALAEVDLASHKSVAAEAALKKSIQCDGNFLESFYMLAQLYMAEKKYTDSEAVLKQGLRILPSSWPLLRELGRTHNAMGKYPEAANDFEQAESFHPDMPAVFHLELANVYVQMDQYGRALAEMETYLHMDPTGPFAASARRASEAMRKQGVTPVATQSNPARPGNP
jgi:tetratricopeptide (TPR) repeat protein